MPLSSSTMKPKRKPRSVSTGLSMFGKISTQAMYSRRSPRVRATCTYSSASMFTAMLRAMRNAPGVKLNTAVQISKVTEEPKAETMISASILLGIEMKASIRRLISSSSHFGDTTDNNAQLVPRLLANTAATNARPTVNRAPTRIRLSMSRPR
ncbi:hypothetical protein D3C73_659560 [compost metagenome]